MITITLPEMVHHYQQVAAPSNQKVVEPGSGVNGRTTHRPAPYNRRKMDGEGLDFLSVFNKVLEKGSR